LITATVVSQCRLVKTANNGLVFNINLTRIQVECKLSYLVD